jgi:transmembrane sensor
MDRNYNTAADFLMDDTFCAYCLGADAAAVKQWEGWLRKHPGQAGVFQEAVNLYHTLNMTDTNQQAAWQQFEDLLSRQSGAKVVPLTPVRRSYKGTISIAAACLAGVVMAGAAYWWLPGKGDTTTLAAVQYDTVFTRKGEQKQITLPDNSTVMLNYNSQLCVPRNYTSNRGVLLKGEAIFNVTQDGQHPFSVSSNGVRTTVLGTVFNVNAYKEGASITVLQGKVGVRSDIDSLVVLPNEQVVYQGNSLRKQMVETSETAGWRSGQLRFKQNSLQDIAFALENKFNIRVRFAQPEIAQEQYTASFKAGMQPDEIARVLCISRNIRFTLKQNELWFSYK